MTIKELVMKAHSAAIERGFYNRHPNVGEKLMLVVSELGEALEAHRNGRASGGMEDYLSEYTESYKTSFFEGLGRREVRATEFFEWYVKDTIEDELADTFIRLADLCGYLNVDIESFISAKMAYNKRRDYKHKKAY